MDISSLKPSDWMKVGGGALMLIAGFLAWWKIDVDGFGSFSSNGFDYTLTGVVPWLLLVAIGVLTFLAAAGIWKLPAAVPQPLVFLAASALSLLLLLFRFISDGADGVSLSRGIGLFLALIAGVLVLVGSVLGFKESGGDLNDLKDMNKIKDQLGMKTNGGDAAPPAP
jgi:hypothetical protein